MMAWRIVNQLSWCAREQGQVELFVHAPSPDICRLARELAATVPGAWQPVPDEALGMITVALTVFGCCVVEWNVFQVARPEGWIAPPDDAAQERAEHAAGEALVAMAASELSRMRRVPPRATEVN